MLAHRLNQNFVLPTYSGVFNLKLSCVSSFHSELIIQYFLFSNKNIFALYFSCDKILSDFEGENQMAKGKDDRISLTLKCTECGEENYLTSKNKKKHPDRLEQKKYCPSCKKVTLHREKKK